MRLISTDHNSSILLFKKIKLKSLPHEKGFVFEQTQYIHNNFNYPCLQRSPNLSQGRTR